MEIRQQMISWNDLGFWNEKFAYIFFARNESSDILNGEELTISDLETALIIKY